MRPLAICIVWYQPTSEQQVYFQSLLPFCTRLYIIDNTPQPVGLPAHLLGDQRLHYEPLGENRGIAWALNRGLDLAYQDGLPWLLTLDQDSQLMTDTQSALLELIQEQPAEDLGLYAAELLHGPGPHASGEAGRLLESAWTSGNFVSVRAARAVGGWDSDLFIDMVDHDFCRKLRKAGYALRSYPTIRLQHRLGDSQRQGRLRFVHYGPIRRYYIFRNTLVYIRRYWYDFPQEMRGELWHLIKQFIKIILFERQKRPQLAMIFRGISDFYRGRLGPFRP